MKMIKFSVAATAATAAATVVYVHKPKIKLNLELRNIGATKDGTQEENYVFESVYHFRQQRKFYKIHNIVMLRVCIRCCWFIGM